MLAQVKEMQASVEQQTRLAAVYEEELKQKHFEVQPYFEYDFNMSNNYEVDEPIYDENDNIIDTYIDKRIEFQLKITNLGELARNLIVRSRKGQPDIQKDFISLKTHRHAILLLKLMVSAHMSF